jgi:hypothetical protein
MEPLSAAAQEIPDTPESNEAEHHRQNAANEQAGTLDEVSPGNRFQATPCSIERGNKSDEPD